MDQSRSEGLLPSSKFTVKPSNHAGGLLPPLLLWGSGLNQEVLVKKEKAGTSLLLRIIFLFMPFKFYL